MSCQIHADDEHDADPFGEAPAHHADAIQKEKGFFTYGGGGYRGKQEAKVSPPTALAAAAAPTAPEQQ